MTNTSLFKKIVVLTLVIIIAAVGVYFLVKYYKPTTPAVQTTNTPKDLVKEALDGNQSLREVRDAFLAKDYQKAISLSNVILKDSDNIVDRSIAETTIAQAQFILRDYTNGAVTYFSIFNNSQYPKTTRASALSNIVQQYRASLDRDLLKVVFADIDSMSQDEIYNAVYQMIYDVYPTGISSAWVGRVTLSKIDRSDGSLASETYNQYLKKIDQDINVQSQGTASAYIVPNTYMAKARFMGFAYKQFNLSSVDEISATYEKAADLAAARADTITQQFALLEYIDFLGRQNEVAKAEAVFKIFASQKVENAIIGNFKQGDIVQNWPGLAYLYTKSKLIKDFADQNGIKP